jgi:hypothetical protein
LDKTDGREDPIEFKQASTVKTKKEEVNVKLSFNWGNIGRTNLLEKNFSIQKKKIPKGKKEKLP